MRTARNLSGAVLLCLFGSASAATADTLPGQLEIRYRAERIEIEFTSPVDPLRVASSIKIDDKERSWELLPDGRTLRLAESLPPRRHDVQITPWAVSPPVLAGLYRKGHTVDAARGDHIGWSLRNAHDLELASEASASPDGVTFRYDGADNLTEASTRTRGIESKQSFPLDASGRNRPTSINGLPLEWDANGNLTRKGDLEIAYDARNRPAHVRRAGQELARYEYDPFNRRVATITPEGRTETVWSGWQDLETHVHGQLSSRRTLGQGLDEIVRQDVDLDGDGTLETTHYPIRDSMGNIVMITDTHGRTVERYDYTPFGQQTIRVDSAPPRVDSLIVIEGVVEVLFSEAIDIKAARDGAAAGQISLYKANGPIELVAAYGEGQGRNAHRRLLLAPAETLAVGTSVQLRLEPAAVLDTFQKPMAQAYERTFDWAEDRVVDDTTRPQLLEIRLRDARAEIEFTERIGPSQAAAAITLDGQSLAWTPTPDGFTVISSTALPTGTHRLQIPTTLTDPTGNPLATAFDQPLTIGPTNHFAYQAPNPESLAASAAGNHYGFQARDKDPSTGWIYLRNRWYDPELGRFVSQDPLGYADGPNRLAYAGNNPVNRGDPLGLYATDFHYGVTMYLGLQFGLRPEDAVRIAASTQMPDADSRQPISSAALGMLLSETNRGQIIDWHFPTADPYGAGEVSRDSTQAWSKARAGIVKGDLQAFGEGLHPLQDSWSHVGVPSLRAPRSVTGIERVAAPGSGIAWFSWPTRTLTSWPDGGHPKGANFWSRYYVPFVSTKADDPSERPDDAVAAALATYRAIADFAARNPGQLPLSRLPRPWSDVEAELRQLFGIKSASGRKAWLLAKGIVLP